MQDLSCLSIRAHLEHSRKLASCLSAFCCLQRIYSSGRDWVYFKSVMSAHSVLACLLCTHGKYCLQCLAFIYVCLQSLFLWYRSPSTSSRSELASTWARSWPRYRIDGCMQMGQLVLSNHLTIAKCQHEKALLKGVTYISACVHLFV